MSRLRVLALTLAGCLACCVNAAGGWELPGSDGHIHSSRELAGAKATVLIFMATDCPISNRYAPLLHRMEAAYRPKGIRFLAVFSGPGTQLDAVKKHLTEYGLDMPGLVDAGALLARQTGARVTPEVAVMSPDGKVLYRGRIDNQYVAWGKTRNAATANDLQNALDSILASRVVAEPLTKALGCSINGLD
jgi:thiol-disulfide isomerase/thioredoxin